MSAIISRQSLPLATAGELRKLLTFLPQDDDNRYAKSSKEKLIQFWSIDGDELRIPYKVASAVFQTFPNWDREIPSRTIKFTEEKLREAQVSVVKDAWTQLSTHTTTTIILPPGSGKTVIGACLAAKAGLVTTILVYRDTLLGQWAKTFSLFTDASVWIVGEQPPEKIDVIICMDTRWQHISKELRSQVGCLIVDEAHAFCTGKRCTAILAFSPRYVILETATPIRPDGCHTMLHALAGEHRVERKSYKPFSITNIHTGIVPTRQIKNGILAWSIFMQSLFYNESRNSYILSLVLANQSKKIGIFTSEVDHATLLSDMVIQAGMSSSCLTGKKKKYKDADVIVGTISKVGTGWDEATSCEDYKGRPIELAIVVTSFREPLLITQVLGRAFRSNDPHIIWLVDNDNLCRSHWKSVKDWAGTLEVPVTMETVTLLPAMADQQ